MPLLVAAGPEMKTKPIFLQSTVKNLRKWALEWNQLAPRSSAAAESVENSSALHPSSPGPQRQEVIVP